MLLPNAESTQFKPARLKNGNLENGGGFLSGVKNVRAAPFRPPASGFDGRLAAFSGSSPVTDAVSTSRVIRFGIYDLDLSHDSANCQILSAGNYKGYLRSVGNKVSEDLQLPVPLTFVEFPFPVTVAPMTSLRAGEAEFDPREKFVVKP
jgi:hypothetical protein